MKTTSDIQTIKLQFGELKITPAVEERLDDLGYTPEELVEAIKEHKSSANNDDPAVYCGTYFKYVNGSIRGLWVNIASFDCFEDFENFCMAIHADEVDPELMFQDYENFPRRWYDEGGYFEDSFNAIKEYIELCEKVSKEAVDDYLEFYEDLEYFEDAYEGKYDSELDFAYKIVDELYDLGQLLGGLAHYFNYRGFADDLFLTDYGMGSNGHVFRKDF